MDLSHCKSLNVNSNLYSTWIYIQTFALSAGAMIVVSSDVIVMRWQSQLGHIDPQMIIDLLALLMQLIVELLHYRSVQLCKLSNLAHIKTLFDKILCRNHPAFFYPLFYTYFLPYLLGCF